MSEEQKPSVIRFEQAVSSSDYENACRNLLDILKQLDVDFGLIHNIECDFPSQIQSLQQDQIVHFCSRLASAITLMFSDPQLHISEEGVQKFLLYQRWIALIFGSSHYVNADHILQKYNANPDPQGEFLIEDNRMTLYKFCILYLPESNINVNLDALWELDRHLCASLCFALQSPRFIGTQAAFSKRNILLQWCPNKFSQIENLYKVPANITHDLYMHCSYDIAKNKHLIKKSLNQLMRNHLITEAGWQDRDVSQIGYKNGKPVMIVVLEHFNSAHSIYRTHSTSMVAAKSQFYLVGIGSREVDAKGREVFDEFLELQDLSLLPRLLFIKQICEQFQAAILYMPSLGMDLTTIFVSNTRLAPIQAIALGHPATTHSDFIEYVIVEDDYVGSEDCFSEKLIRLPKDALPYVPSALAPDNVEYHLRENPEVVKIAIAATTMKMNPYFLDTLKLIRDRSKVPVHFHFLLGQSMGVTHPYVNRFIRNHLGDSATAHPHTPYLQYLQIMHSCDLVLNPFPFGNTNGIIDMVTLGLVGVCKTGDEVHEHIDEGLFKRLGLPEWLIANTVDEYIERALRLIENHQERLELRRHIIENNGLQTLFTGDPTPMGKMLFAKLQEWAVANNVVLETEQAVSSDKKSATKAAKAKSAPKVAKPKATKPKAEKAKTEKVNADKSKSEKTKVTKAKSAAKK